MCVRDSGVMDLDSLRWLRSSEGQWVLRECWEADQSAHELAAKGDPRATDPLRLATAIRKRHPDIDGTLIAEALTQTELRRRASSKLGHLAPTLLYIRDGLEQASRTIVAEKRAARLRAAGTEMVADLGCGIGLDSLAFASAGIRVEAVERDPLVATLAEANAELAGLDTFINVHVGDLTQHLNEVLPTVDTLFLDPARRDPHQRIDGRSKRTLDPQNWSPPWSWISSLAQRTSRIAVKVAPGIPHELTPEGGCTTWTSVDGDLVEAEVMWPGLNIAGIQRMAVAIRRGHAHELTSAVSMSDETPPPVGSIGGWIMEPDDAVIRSGLVAVLAERSDARLIDPRVAYLTCDSEPAPSPFMTAFRVEGVLPYRLETLKQKLIERKIGKVIVKKRAINIDPDTVRRQLNLRGDASAVVVITRIGDEPWAFICTPQSAVTAAPAE
mgnify:FL=1